MILTFSKQHPVSKQPTDFMLKILAYYLNHANTEDKFDLIYRHIKKLGLFNDVVYYSSREEYKLNTIRKGHRWKKGDKIHYYLGNPRNGGFRFWEGECTGTQDIFITFYNGMEISIEDKYQYWGDKNLLAKNDGLNYDDFETWFYHATNKGKEDFSGQIIHWGNFRYS